MVGLKTIDLESEGQKASGSGRTITLATLIAAVSIAHYLTPESHYVLHSLYQRLYYVPILLACAWFGLRGGIAVAVICAASYVPHVVFQWSHHRAYQASQVVELAMFGLIAGVAGALSDRERTLRRRAEEAAAERDKALRDLEATVETLRRADRLAALGTLAAGMAHEIRNPLGALGGAVEIIDRDFAPDHPHREFVDILQREIGRLNTLAGKYLDFARPQKPDLRPTDINAVLVAAVELVRKSAARQGVSVEVRQAADLQPALADPVQIHQALVNLLLNGMQAMPRGGEIEVATSSEGARVVVTVRDHGAGLPLGPVERLFEPFFTTKPGGTGLGLAMCRQIASGHGGDIEAASAEGGGAVFRLALPTVTALTG